MHHCNLPVTHWTSVLSISTKYEFPAIRTRAIAELTKQIVLARTHGVPDWLPAAYRRIALRDAPLEEVEAEKLGLRTTVRLGVRSARALRVAPGSEAGVAARRKEEEAIARRVVEEVFGQDLALAAATA